MLKFWKKKSHHASALIGEWKLVRSEGSAHVGVEGVTIVFTDDGKLIYTIHESDKKQIINLIYHVSGNVLLTDQPSHPKVERTTFDFELNGQLVLNYSGGKTWFERIVT